MTLDIRVVVTLRLRVVVVTLDIRVVVTLRLRVVVTL